ncbi:H-NS family nucleoid-associated regulatory protein [Burkholderia ubonensis]|uniref:H-NS histone family protein n=1 Tax=Burkholderia ubonensis TaxID=101571 RepID=UPI0009B38455|nr:H-NS histone family protein [Burkholderia ubonensis]
MATLKAIQSKIAKLQMQAELMAEKQALIGLEKIRDLMEKHGVTLADIEGFVSRKRGRKPGAAAAKHAKATNQVKRVVAAKYRNPETGETWSGRGRAPAWIKDAKDRSSFFIRAPAEKKGTTRSASKGAAAQKVATKKAAAKSSKADSKPVRLASATAARKKGRHSNTIAAKATRTRRPAVTKKAAEKAGSAAKPEVAAEAAGA